MCNNKIAHFVLMVQISIWDHHALHANSSKYKKSKKNNKKQNWHEIAYIRLLHKYAVGGNTNGNINVRKTGKIYWKRYVDAYGGVCCCYFWCMLNKLWRLGGLSSTRSMKCKYLCMEKRIFALMSVCDENLKKKHNNKGWLEIIF